MPKLHPKRRIRFRLKRICSKGKADPLEAAIEPLVGAGVVTRLAKHDTNPANSPQMPEKYRSGS